MTEDGVRGTTPPSDGVAATPDTLFGLSFESVNRAQQFMLAVQGLGEDGKLHLADAVMVVKDHNDHVRVSETVDLQAGRTAFSGAMWTGLLGLIVGGPVGWIAGLGIGAGVGALTAKVVDLGIPDEWVAWFKDAVQIDTATVVVLAGDINQRALASEVDRFPGARLVHTTIDADAFSRLTAETSARSDSDCPPNE
ncbi:MAG: putative membrane protein [Candidatus Aldehydirespiratoraceae bacterium]|jgi:uncharacterized membrane protein